MAISQEVGAHARLGEKRIDPKFHDYIQHTIENGYVVIERAFTEEEADEANDVLHNLAQSVEGGGPASTGGRNKFEGLKTQRIYALLNKSRVFDKFALHPAVLALNDFFLDPGWLMHTMHSINIQPDEDPQTLHHDDGSITVPRPHKPFGSAIMVALDPYTKDNGATVVVPQSHTWGSDPIPSRDQAVPVIMPKGSIVYFLGTLWHGGGRNTSSQERRAMTVQYCQPWVRPFENQFLCVDWEKLDEIPSQLVDMMGYKVGAPFVGYADGQSPRRIVAQRLQRMKKQLEEARKSVSKL